MEMANILGLKMRSGFLSASEVKDAVRLLQLPDIATDETTRHLQLPNLLGIVERYRLTTYDATYLDVAVREALPLATFDKEMIIAAKQYAVPIAGAI